MKEISSVKVADGTQLVIEHESACCNCTMTLGVFLPPQAKKGPVPVIYYLSGLTCTHENVVTKAGAQRYATEHGVALITPDTSPRGAGIEGEDDNWHLGTGAGFYVDATTDKWSSHYQMYTYITQELPDLINAFPIDPSRCSIMGHSMGGHGALVIGLRNPDQYRSISAFSPISSPIQCPWGQDALSEYLGPDQTSWPAYDATELLKITSNPQPILIDQGEADNFLEEQLKPQLIQDLAIPTLELNLRPDYDHSYYFISSFIGAHISFHAKHLA